MTRPASVSTPHFDLEIIEAFAANDRIHQFLLEQLDPRAWRAKAPGRGVRTIAAIFAHVHNIRCKWIRLSAPHLKVPARLDRSRCTAKQAAKALADSAGRCCEMLEQALTDPKGKVPSFLRDGWSRPWPPGPAMFAYMLAHEAHHRGQICMLAHQLGFPLPASATSAMWNWEKLWQDCGFERLDRPRRQAQR
jgi:uncharacterized damage-inducible protein DinB